MATARTTTRWPRDVHTLSVDIGGSGFKAAVLDALGQMVTERVRIDTPYPCPPEQLIRTLQDLVTGLDASYHRVSVGFPGLVRAGRVVNIPSLSRARYGGPPDAALVTLWHGFDLAGALSASFAVPVKVANDADVQGCAAVEGDGFEFVMTLGTGTGTSLFYRGQLLPHMELGHAPFRKGGTFEDHLGNAARKRLGNKRWSRLVVEAVEAYDRFLFFDRIYLGGGNTKHLCVPLPAKAVIVPNTAGILGGVKIWTMDASG